MSDAFQESKEVVEEAGRKAILIPGDIASEEHIKCASAPAKPLTCSLHC
jgi:hypothetical protein